MTRQRPVPFVLLDLDDGNHLELWQVPDSTDATLAVRSADRRWNLILTMTAEERVELAKALCLRTPLHPALLPRGQTLGEVTP